MNSCKTCEESEILAFLSFTHASRRHETPGSKTEGFFTHSTESSMSFMFKSVLPPPPNTTGQCREALVDAGQTVGFVEPRVQENLQSYKE